MLADGFDFVVDLQKSRGAYLFDSKTGRTFLDFFSFFASGSLGMNHPGLSNPEFIGHLGSVAVNKPSNSDAYTTELAGFVDTFGRIAMPRTMEYVFFVDGGALGVENAIKAAFDWKVRKNMAKGVKEERGRQIIHFRRAFHGRTGYTMSMTNTDPNKVDYFPKFSWPRVHNPAIRFPLNDQNLEKVKQEEETALGEIRQAIKTHGNDIAGLIIEPIQAEGGDNHFRPEFLQALRTICDENEILLIFDEVQTGIGLTGKMWAFEHYVEPDLIVFGKKTQVCGFMSSGRIDDVEQNVFHKTGRINSTFGGNLVDMVRFARILEVIDEENLVENARVVGNYLLSQLETLQSDFPGIVSNARGRGLFCAIDVDTPMNRDLIRSKAYENGLIILGCGERTIRFRTALNIGTGEIDEGMKIIRGVLGGMKKGA
jgi:L-lysine 6-transaminase